MMKRRTVRFLSMLVAVMMAVSLLPAAALADEGGRRVATSPEGLDAGEYYFDMDSGELYALLSGRRYDEKLAEDGAAPEDAEAYAAQRAPLDLAAFRAAEWSVDTGTLALSAAFPAGYDPSPVFSLQDAADGRFMLGLLRLAAEDALPWVEAPMPMNMNEVAGYAHGQYYINTQLVFDHFFDEAYAEISADPETYGWETDWDLGVMCDRYASGQISKLALPTYHYLPGEPVFSLRQTWGEDGEQPLYFPLDYAAGTDGTYASVDLSEYVMEYHDYLDPVWDWIDPDHVTVTFECYLGTAEDGDGSGDRAVFELSGGDIVKNILREPTELTDGEVECTASVDFISAENKIRTYTNTKVLTLPATGDPQRLTITEQPRSTELSYPDGAVFTVAVDDPDFAASYQWYDTDAIGRPVLLDGLTATTPTLVLPSTTLYNSSFDFFCVITDRNGNKTVSDTAHVEMYDRGHRPVFYVGDIAVQPGETLDLSTTELGTGTVTFEGNAVTLDHVVIDVDRDHLLFDTVNSPSLGMFAACSGCVFEDSRFYIHVAGDCVINSNYYNQAIYSSGTCLEGHFRASDVETATTLVIDGDGTLTLHGGGNCINTDSALTIDAGLRTRSNGQYYNEGIYANGDLRITSGTDVDIQSFGPGIFVDCVRNLDATYTYHDIYIEDGAAVKIDATAAHVHSLSTALYGMLANGNIFAGAADLDIALHAVTDTMKPYGGRINGLTGMTAFNVLLEGTGLSIDIDAETDDGELYANGAYGISGDSLQRLYLSDGAKADIRIDTPIVRDAAEGVESGWTWQDEDDLGITIEEGCSLNVGIRSTGMAVFGIDLASPVRVEDGILNVSVEASGADMVFGVSSSGVEAVLDSDPASVTAVAKDGIAIFTSDGSDLLSAPDGGSGQPVTVEHIDPADPQAPGQGTGFAPAPAAGLTSGGTEYDPDYVPRLITLSGRAVISSPKNGLISRYGFPYYGSLIPGETVFAPSSTDVPAQSVAITVSRPAPEPDPGPVPDTVVEPAVLPFDDVKEADWFFRAVRYVYEKGLMNGVADRVFDPDGTATRAMLVTVLYRLEGRPPVSGDKVFDDAAPGAWYGAAVQWAAENGIVNGYGDGRFGPDDPVTREQFAVILYRYAGFRGHDTAGRSDLSGYADAQDISSWAEEAMKWANAEGMITGREAAMLAPKGGATRAEAAKILSLSPLGR